MTMLIVPKMYIKVDGVRLATEPLTVPSPSPFPRNISMSFYPRIPCRIRKMSRRRQKKAVPAYLNQVMFGNLLELTDRPIDRDFLKFAAETIYSFLDELSGPVKVDLR